VLLLASLTVVALRACSILTSISQCAEAAEHEAADQDADSVHSAVYVLQFDAETGTLQQPQGTPV
jgi:hypothetical protein